jgi:hypothetical protein
MSVQPTVSAHHLHDELLIARLAGDDVTAAERAAAVGLVETCAECAALASDLRAIISDMATLPAPPRPRDFRLTPADAARVRPRGMLARIPLLRSRATAPRYGFAGALGAAMATLGLAGILVSGATTLLPQAGSTVLFGAGGAGGGAAAQSQAGAPSYAMPAPSLGVELTSPPRVVTAPASSPASGAVASPAASASAFAPSPQPNAAATAAPAASASAAGGGTSRDASASAPASPVAMASNPEEVTAGPALAAPPQPPAQPLPIVPIASLGLVIVGLALLLYSRLAGGRSV